MNKKKDNIVLTKEFLDDWSDRCDIPMTKMKEIYDALKETLKQYVDQKRGVQLSNFIQLIPTKRTTQTSYHDIVTGERITKDRELPFVFKLKLSDYLKYPYPYTDYPERKIKNKQESK